MSFRIRHGLIISIAIIGLFIASAVTSYAETTNYIYDELNRLIRVEYEDGTVVYYIYDKADNRLKTHVGIDVTPPTTTASPGGGAMKHFK